MRSGELNRRIVIERRATASDGVQLDRKGQAVISWVEVCKKWASITTLAGNEALRAQAIVAEASVEIVTRWRSDITADMRVLYGARRFDIGAALDVDTKHEQLRLICTEGLNRGG